MTLTPPHSSCLDRTAVAVPAILAQLVFVVRSGAGAVPALTTALRSPETVPTMVGHAQKGHAAPNGVGVEVVLIIVLRSLETVLITEAPVLLGHVARSGGGVELGQTIVVEHGWERLGCFRSCCFHDKDIPLYSNLDM
jgi:hypothetical protein